MQYFLFFAPQGSGAEADVNPDSDSIEEIPGSQLLWKIAPRPANSAQVSDFRPFIIPERRSFLWRVRLTLICLQMYSFTTFAMQLNELDQEIQAVLPKTDCRLRPDIRAMENGDIGKNGSGMYTDVHPLR